MKLSNWILKACLFTFVTFLSEKTMYIWPYLPNLEMYLFFALAVPPPDIDPADMTVHERKAMCVHLLTAAWLAA